jgi:carbon storage regulator
MLVLSRELDEAIVLGDNIIITVVEIRGDRVKLGITAPADIPVHRLEVRNRIEREHGQPETVVPPPQNRHAVGRPMPKSARKPPLKGGLGS